MGIAKKMVKNEVTEEIEQVVDETIDSGPPDRMTGWKTGSTTRRKI